MPVIDLDDLDKGFFEGGTVTFGDRGFHVHFHSYVLSVQIGYGNYCANKDYSRGYGENPSHCHNAEIAIWPIVEEGKRSGMLPFSTDPEQYYNTVRGWVPGFQICRIVPLIRNMRPDNQDVTMRNIVTILDHGVNESLIEDIVIEGVDHNDHPDYCDAYISDACIDGEQLTQLQLENLTPDYVYEQVMDSLR